MMACSDHFLVFAAVLNPVFAADTAGTGAGPHLVCHRISGAPLYTNPLYGVCSKVHAATVPSLLTVSVRLFDFSLHGPPCTESGPGGSGMAQGGWRFRSQLPARRFVQERSMAAHPDDIYVQQNAPECGCEL